MLLLDLATQARLPDWPLQPAPLAHSLPACEERTRLIIRPDYPYARLGAFVRAVLASKERHDGKPAAAAFREALLQPIKAERLSDTEVSQRFRSFVMLQEQEGLNSKLVSAGVLHQRAELKWSAPDELGDIVLDCMLHMAASHLGSRLHEGDLRPAVMQLAISDVLRQLSFACKEVFIQQQRTVKVRLHVSHSGHVTTALGEAYALAFQQESWRIGAWRAA
jgi:hypothetical protein